MTLGWHLCGVSGSKAVAFEGGCNGSVNGILRRKAFFISFSAHFEDMRHYSYK